MRRSVPRAGLGGTRVALWIQSLTRLAAKPKLAKLFGELQKPLDVVAPVRRRLRRDSLRSLRYAIDSSVIDA